MTPNKDAPSAEHVLDVRDLHTYYFLHDHAVQAVKGVNLWLARQQMLGLVGESGCGKTTLARSILRLVRPPGRIVQGEVWLDGQELLCRPEPELQRIRGRDIAMIIPNPRGELNPLLPIGDQIATVAKAHLHVGTGEARSLARDMLRAVGIPDPLRRFKAYPHELSGGMAQRVVIAIALITSPKVVMSDDATSGLDVTIQAQILDLLDHLVREKHAAALFITRDIAIVAHHCSTVAIMYAGQIMEYAAVAEFFRNPAHPYSVKLLAAFSYNAALRAQWTVPGRALNVASPIGCPYAMHCVRAQRRCVDESPPWRELSPGHFARCHFPVGS